MSKYTLSCFCWLVLIGCKSLWPDTRAVNALKEDKDSVSNTKIYGHRGDFKFYPENTISAFKSAMARKSYNDAIVGFELDVQVMTNGMGKDIVVVLHDDNLLRTTEPGQDKFQSFLKKNIWELNYDDIKDISVGSGGEKVPTLKSVLDLVSDDSQVLIELKTSGDAIVDERLVKAMADIFSDPIYQAKSKSLDFISFDAAILEALASDIRTKNIGIYRVFSEDGIRSFI